jgi:hypothetical protein
VPLAATAWETRAPGRAQVREVVVDYYAVRCVVLGPLRRTPEMLGSARAANGGGGGDTRLSGAAGCHGLGDAGAGTGPGPGAPCAGACVSDVPGENFWADIKPAFGGSFPCMMGWCAWESVLRCCCWLHAMSHPPMLAFLFDGPCARLTTMLWQRAMNSAGL